MVVFVFLGLMIFGGQKVRAVSCGWCGSSCVDTTLMGRCLPNVRSSDVTCVNVDGICTVKQGVPTTVKCIPRPACLDSTPPCRIRDTENYCPNVTPSQPTPTPIPTVYVIRFGDANGDGKVNLVDFDIWKKEYLKINITKKADFDKNGSVNLVDFDIWKSGYLNTVLSSITTIRVMSPVPLETIY